MMEATATPIGYRATRTDGLLIVHDVEIFCACERGEFAASEVWVKKAFDKAMAEAREGYHPPLHIRHHEVGVDPVAVGTFRVTGVRPITLAGKRRNAIVVDYHVTNQEAADELLAGKLPYRSVEIFDIDAVPSIDGLALLDHEAPFLRLPMLMVHDLDDRSTLNAASKAGAFRAGRCINPLSREETMSATETPPTTDFGAGVAEIKTVSLADDAPKKDDDDKGEAMEDGDGALDVSAVVKAISSGAISIADMDAILEAIQSQGAAPEEADPEQPAPAAAPGAESMKGQQMTAEMAALRGELDGLKAKDAAREAKTAVDADVATAMERLKDVPCGALDTLKERLTTFRATATPANFTAYVDALAGAASAPGEDGKAQSFASQSGTVPAVAMKYLENGGNSADVDRASNFARQWQELNSRGLTKTSQESYVQINMTSHEEVQA